MQTYSASEGTENGFLGRRDYNSAINPTKTAIAKILSLFLQKMQMIE
jgi:hypothetical protein